jgi:hypothetical protein
MFAPITNVNEGESNTPSLAHWKWHTPRVEKWSKALLLAHIQAKTWDVFWLAAGYLY